MIFGGMMQEEAFRAWLQAGGGTAEAARNTRIYAVRTIENNLAKLGSVHGTLEDAWREDQFAQLRQRLKELRDDFLAGGTQFRILMPQSENPAKRLSNWRAWLGQYGRFLSGEPRGSQDADRIREYVLEHYVEPARASEEDTVSVRVRDVNQALGLNQAWPNICQVLLGKIFLAMADLELPEMIGAPQSSATVFRFYLEGDAPPEAGDQAFVLFDSGGQTFKPVRNYNRRTERSAFRVKPPGASNATDDALELDTITEVARAMLVDGLPSRVKSTAGGPVNYLKYGGEKLVRYELDPRLAAQIGVPPQGASSAPIAAAHPIAPTPQLIETTMPMIQPTNLIFYGPPGTGKTFRTAQKAVELCGVEVPSTREELMQVYQGLLEAGRIEFVTFHQSMAYEDFVEGLRPTQSNQDGSAGFSLQPVPGVFRRIAKRAETSTGPGRKEFSLGDRRVFKMSIGEAANPEEAHLFEEAIASGYTLLGFDDINWSDARYAERDNIVETVRIAGAKREGDISALSGPVQMPHIFRNWLKPGDLIVVSKGNSLFRAIGEVTGGYEFLPRPEGGYAHRRAVRWLWIDRDGAPVGEIYTRDFMMKSIYLLNKAELRVPALERYLSSQQDTGSGTPEPFVLIIDEINRANISKVFGELITLLEPDKRLGQLNALKVRLPYSPDLFGVPSNLHIIGTMNTADRSIALLDTALRRRFQFEELMPDPSQLQVVDGIGLARMLASFNERIEYFFDREHQIGHAYFIGCQSRADVDAAMRHKVIPLLAEYFYEDWSKVAAVLGEATDGEGDREGRFLDRKRLSAPKGLGDDDSGSVRFRWAVRSAFSYDDFTAS